MKKIISIFLAAILIFSFAACSTTNINPTAEETTLIPETGSSSDTKETSPVAESTGYKTQVAKASYPVMQPYPDEAAFTNKDTGEFDSEGYNAAIEAWSESYNQIKSNLAPDYNRGLDSFFKNSIQKILASSATENTIYSPINVFMALSMLAETTSGESRAQLLDCLGIKDIDTLREKANSIWRASYIDDVKSKTILGNSIWLNNKINYNKDTLGLLAGNYYASSFSGEMGSEEYNQDLRSWINEQTNNLLKDQTNGISMDPETIMSLVSTIYLKAGWSEEFYDEAVEDRVFHGAQSETTVPFMNQKGSDHYFYGNKFGAVLKPLSTGGEMIFILPNEDSSLTELLENDELYNFINSDPYTWENSKFVTVNLSVPKFDVSSDLNLIKTLQDLGVKDIFEPKDADFSPLADLDTDVYVSQVKHDARVKIDEKGVEAAAFTIVKAEGASMPPEETIDFILDRPFLFVIKSPDGLPLFTGTVNQL